MGFELNHAIVHCTDKRGAAAFFASLIDAAAPRPSGPFMAVAVNDRLTLDYFEDAPFVFGHFAFLVDEADFDAVLGRAVAGDHDHGSGPFARDRAINRLNGGRGVYVWDPDGNSYEFFTVDPLADGAQGEA